MTDGSSGQARRQEQSRRRRPCLGLGLSAARSPRPASSSLDTRDERSHSPPRRNSTLTHRLHLERS